MKVYIVAEKYVFESNELFGVYDSKAKAEKYIADNPRKFVGAAILEFEVQ